MRHLGNERTYTVKSLPQWGCSKCKKKFQTKAIAAQHERREHGVQNDHN